MLDISLDIPSKKSAAALTLVGVWCRDDVDDDMGMGVDNCEPWTTPRCDRGPEEVLAIP